MIENAEAFKEEDSEIKILKSALYLLSSDNEQKCIGWNPNYNQNFTFKDKKKQDEHKNELQSDNDINNFFRINLFENLQPLTEDYVKTINQCLFQEYKTENAFFNFDSKILLKLFKFDLKPVIDYMVNCGLKSLGTYGDFCYIL